MLWGKSNHNYECFKQKKIIVQEIINATMMSCVLDSRLSEVLHFYISVLVGKQETYFLFIHDREVLATLCSGGSYSSAEEKLTRRVSLD